MGFLACGCTRHTGVPELTLPSLNSEPSIGLSSPFDTSNAAFPPTGDKTAAPPVAVFAALDAGVSTALRGRPRLLAAATPTGLASPCPPAVSATSRCSTLCTADHTAADQEVGAAPGRVSGRPRCRARWVMISQVARKTSPPSSSHSRRDMAGLCVGH